MLNLEPLLYVISHHDRELRLAQINQLVEMFLCRCVTVLLIALSLSGVVLIVDPDSLAQANNTLPKLNLVAAAAALSETLFTELET